MTNNKKEKILLIEDDSFLLSMYSTKFEMEGFEVMIAKDGEEGLDAILNQKPDLVLLDILLPKMNGFDLLEKLKEKNLINKIPILLLTNLSHRDEIKKALDMGVKDCLVKAHFMPSEVVERVRNVLKK